MSAVVRWCPHSVHTLARHRQEIFPSWQRLSVQQIFNAEEIWKLARVEHTSIERESWPGRCARLFAHVRLLPSDSYTLYQLTHHGGGARLIGWAPPYTPRRGVGTPPPSRHRLISRAYNTPGRPGRNTGPTQDRFAHFLVLSIASETQGRHRADTPGRPGRTGGGA